MDDSVFAIHPGRKPWWYRRTIFDLGEARSDATDWWYGGPIYEDDENEESSLLVQQSKKKKAKRLKDVGTLDDDGEEIIEVPKLANDAILDALRRADDDK